jgi:hypothetical protein
MSDDSQEQAEALDADKVDDDADFTGDDVGEGLPDFPPDRPLGVNTVGVTPVEEDAGESFAERTMREVPDPAAQLDLAAEQFDYEAEDEDDLAGQLVEPDASTLDHEAQEFAEEEPAAGLAAEEQAMHIEEDGH